MLEAGGIRNESVPWRDNLKGGSIVARLESVTSLAVPNRTTADRFKTYMLEELDADSSRIPLSVASFLSGFIGCVSFSACSIW